MPTKTGEVREQDTLDYITHKLGVGPRNKVDQLLQVSAVQLAIIDSISLGGIRGPKAFQSEAAALTSLLYSGEAFDSRIGMQYLRARFYDPNVGRFNRLDPFSGNLRDPQSLHKYLYTHGDPVNGIDPTGRLLGLIGGLYGLMIGSIISSGAKSAYDARAVGAGVGIVGKLAFLAVRSGAPAAGMVTGYLATSFVTRGALSSQPIWNLMGGLPGREENRTIDEWAENIEESLKTQVDIYPELTVQQKEAGYKVAEKLSQKYVLAVQDRGKRLFGIEDSNDLLFGKGGGPGDWLGNWIDPQCNCEYWAMDMYSAISSGGVTGGWKLRGHFGQLKAGDFSLGWMFKHNFVSLTFDPNDTGADPSFILDPWSRVRPDIYDYEQFNRHWPIDSGFEWEPIGQ